MSLTLLSVCSFLWETSAGFATMGLDAGLLRAAVQRLFQQRRGENQQKINRASLPDYLALLFLRTAPLGGDQALALGCGAGDWLGPWEGPEGELGGGERAQGPPICQCAPAI